MTEQQALELLMERTWHKNIWALANDGETRNSHWMDYLFLTRVVNGLER